MEDVQLLIWPESEWGPKLKSKKEIKAEAKEAFNKRLLERVVLPEERIKVYNAPLNKEDLIKYDNKHNCNSRLGIPQMLLTTLSKYLEKEQKDLFVYDLMILSNSIKSVFPEEVEYNELKKFSKANKLFFGNTQYDFMEIYVKSLD